MVQQAKGHKDIAELKDEIKELSKFIQDLSQRDGEREQLLKNCSKKIETLKKEATARKAACRPTAEWSRKVYACCMHRTP